jgi:predicted thioesterase
VTVVGNQVLLNDKVVAAVGNRVLLNGKVVGVVGNQVTVDVTTLQYHIY